MLRPALAMLLFGTAAQAVVLDRIAVVVDHQVIKDSDIERELRVTDFLNRTPLNLSETARKQATSRLIDQMIIRGEIEVAQYQEATPAEVQGMMAQLRKERYPAQAAFSRELAVYGITEAELRKHLAWQITVLHFIEQRFRPGVLVTDAEVQKYFTEHAAEIRRTAKTGPVTVDTERGRIENQLAEERVNKNFFDWLDEERKTAKIRYLEPELK